MAPTGSDVISDQCEAAEDGPGRLLLLGDSHGNTTYIRNALEVAKAQRCHAVLQLGDFGVWPGSQGIEYLDAVERLLVRSGVNLYFIDGNHDDHVQLIRARSRARRNAMVPIRPHVIYLPRGMRWSWRGVRFGAMGGAYSIDGQYRTPGVSWWPDLEEPNLADAGRLGDGPLDVLVTHDAPARASIVGAFDLPGRIAHAADQTRILLDDVMTATKPRLVVHGHHHQWTTTVMPDETRIQGLAADIQGDERSWAVLELPDLTLRPVQAAIDHG